jgi:class 3 adenylate cyclase
MQATLAGQDLTIAGRPVRARIGINTGEALIGNIGSPLHFSYTAMGDTVNLASRIEHLNKAYGTGILVSAATALACGGAVRFRSVGMAEVAGRNETVMLYEPEAVEGTAAT